MCPSARSDSRQQRIVIVGAGLAGIQVADALREGGHTGSVTVIGEEPAAPYHRPPLSKDFLLGQTNLADLSLRAPQFFADRDIDLRTGAAAVRIDRTARAVRLANGGEVDYDSLVLATGAANRTLNVPGTHLTGVYSLRTIADAEGLHAHLERARSLLIIGAGFIGLEIAAVAHARGLDVTILEAARQPLARALSPEVANHLADAHRRNGVDLRLSETVAQLIDVDGAVAAAITASGARIDADVVVVAVGVVPRVELAIDAGLPVENGIVVDENLCTPDPAIYAVGDCANHPNLHAGGRSRFESVQNAVDQAKRVAATVLGAAGPYTALPWFWSHQGDLKFQITGVRHLTDRSFVLGDTHSGRFSVCSYRRGRLVAVESMNRPADHQAARRILGAGRSPNPEQLSEPTFSLKEFSQSDSPLPVR